MLPLPVAGAMDVDERHLAPAKMIIETASRGNFLCPLCCNDCLVPAVDGDAIARALAAARECQYAQRARGIVEAAEAAPTQQIGEAQPCT